MSELERKFKALQRAYRKWQGSDSPDDYDNFVTVCEKALV